MPRLPIAGSDQNVWGDILNDFLLQSHSTDGSLDDEVVDDSNVSASANIAQSKIANLTTDLSSRASTSTTITGATSLSGGGDLSTNRTISLVNDSASPGNNRYYGTDGSGTKGYHALSSSGETNTASNVGTAGVGVFNQKTGVDLEFKNINAGSTKVTVTDDAANDEIDIDVDESNFSGIPQSAVTGLVTGLSSKVDSSTATTKGDILAATAANAITRVGVGSDGYVLSADSTESTGVKWIDPSTYARFG